jgi:F-type H+-transporting ATPase subunit epsilon
MANRFHLEIIVPTSIYFNDDVDSVSVVTSDGVLTILAEHADLIANIEISHLVIRQNGHLENYAVSGGVLNIYQKENKVMMMVNAIESQDEIDYERANKAKDNAQKRLQEEELSLREQQKTEIKLKRALNRLSLRDLTSH